VTDQLLGVRGRPGRLRGVGVFGAAGSDTSTDAPRARPKPNCFAIVDRRSLYAGAVSKCSPGKLHRARYASGVSRWRVVRWRRSMLPVQPHSRQVTLSCRTDRRIETAGVRSMTASVAGFPRLERDQGGELIRRDLVASEIRADDLRREAALRDRILIGHLVQPYRSFDRPAWQR
jgi:hypothetical protein